MKRILKIGMDVHSKSYTLCAMESRFFEEDIVLHTVKVSADYKNIILFIESIKQKYGNPNDDLDITCGYEAGCLGYSLYRNLTNAGVKCVILAPTTMLTEQGRRIKTDSRDAELIAKCLCSAGYKAVYVPDAQDDAVKEYIRMRADHVSDLKRIKQRIRAFLMRFDYQYDKTWWTQAHLTWINQIDFISKNYSVEVAESYNKTLREYLSTYYFLASKIIQYDKEIEEMADHPRYEKKVKELGCLLGVKMHTALSAIVETGDFNRFRTGNIYAAYLGLAPHESSSGNKVGRGGITKAGNITLRKMLIESSQGIARGKIGYKGKSLKSRQSKCEETQVIAYADLANIRMRKKYYRMIRNSKKHNVAVTAIARELACFMWGIMTDNIDIRIRKKIA